MATQVLDANTRATIVRKAVRNVFVMLLYTGGALLLAAGRWDWPQAWVLILILLAYFTAWVSWGLRNNSSLLMERADSMAHDSPAWDKAIVRFNMLLSLGLYVVAGLDFGRYHWSEMPGWLQMVGLVLSVLGYALPLWALTSNPFASGVVRIQKERGHTVSKQGPYAYIRHPMYAGVFVYGIGAPLFLGSWWALIPGLLMIGLFATRTLLEDRTLREELEGYKEYAQEVRYRWVPGIW